MVVLHRAILARTALADILERGARAAHVCEIYAALRPVAVMTRHAVVQHFAKSHSHSRARLGGKLHVGNRRAVLPEINYVRFARLDLEAERHRLAVLETVAQNQIPTHDYGRADARRNLPLEFVGDLRRLPMCSVGDDAFRRII